MALGSIVARKGLPGRSEYSASKFSLAGLIEALRAEWHRDGIHLLLVNPGFTQTEFERNVLVDTAVMKTERKRTMTPEQVALATLRGIARRRRELNLSSGGRLLLLTNRVCPGLVEWGLARWTDRLFRRLETSYGPKSSNRPLHQAAPGTGLPGVHSVP